MELTFASYNIHKAVGLDRRRDPDRILAILHEIDADVIALQEADRRFGRRESVLPLDRIEDLGHYKAIQLGHRPHSIGWHGNALLVRRHFDVVHAGVVALPTIEPRGAVRADLLVQGRRLRVVGMHLDLSGLRRRHQLRTILTHLGRTDHHCPTVLMGDFNEWSLHGGSLREFHAPWRVLMPGASFPSRRPIAALDRVVVSAEWELLEAGVHHSPLSARGSDHLPVFARLQLPKF